MVDNGDAHGSQVNAHLPPQNEEERLREEVLTLRTALETQRLSSILLGIRLEAILSSRAYPAILFAHKVSTELRSMALKSRGKASRSILPIVAGEEWIEYTNWTRTFDTPDLHRLTELKRRIGVMAKRPTITLVIPTDGSASRHLEEAINSVKAQIYPFWKLLIVDDASPRSTTSDIARRASSGDDRIRIIRRSEKGGISAATNSGLDEVATEWVALMNHEDQLASHALLLFALAIANHPHADLIYSDEDKIDGQGRRHEPLFKCDFDPVLLLATNYIAHLVTVRTELVKGLGGFRSEFDGAQDWDFILRATERVDENRILHIPHVLYHRRAHAGFASLSSVENPQTIEQGFRVVEAALARRCIAASVERIAGRELLRVIYRLPNPLPLVSIMIPTRDGVYLKSCLDSLLGKTAYPNFDVTVIDNRSTSTGTMNYLKSLEGRIAVIRDDGPFNYSALHNRSVRKVDGELLLFLNDDIEIIESGWLSAMVAMVEQPGVGATGAKLIYPDGRIQHAGVVLAPLGIDHAFRFSDAASPGYCFRLLVAQQFSAITAACMIVRRKAWEAAGGFNETLAVAYNDIDLCLRLGRLGWKVNWTPDAVLIHHESASRGLDFDDHSYRRALGEERYMRDHWNLFYEHDPAYNPNLGMPGRLFGLAWPPRVSPWYIGDGE
jgi:GT2 family glycosyltransferase